MSTYVSMCLRMCMHLSLSLSLRLPLYLSRSTNTGTADLIYLSLFMSLRLLLYGFTLRTVIRRSINFGAQMDILDVVPLHLVDSSVCLMRPVFNCASLRGTLLGDPAVSPSSDVRLCVSLFAYLC
ncbi:putative transmembrane protein [Toxoplasma gondii TgCatPRC2]|uniref:Putative transmembrane protein n=1 Tax=Toxoplasma gondii TgCatPRC2 TaxID=1130821 RepID=A0A151HHT0_TOXGO|nr:putative transmembrane protein [Toxoplasma gondii TgCatPRC2]